MFLVDKIILVAGVLLVLGTISSKFSARLGLPVLVLFLVLGMLAGSEGIGGIEFDDPVLAHGIATMALALILFDGGMRTSLDVVRRVWKPAGLLATVGVLVTSIVTGAAAAWILGIPLLQGVLLGSIVGSTDAAAVFAVLRSAGVRLPSKLAGMLEVESGSNDPMAIFLTVGLLEVLLGRVDLGLDLAKLFVMQMGVGTVVGVLLGKLAVLLVNRINLQAAGLYPVLTSACGAVAFGVAAALGGSGFLAVYLAGIMLGNSRLVFARGTLLFHDGLAWAAQITMFVVLGLLSSPSELVKVGWQGLAIAAVLVFVARPIAVVPLLLPFRLSARELLLVSWVGLKGAVPIILATFPLLFGLSSGPLLFNVVFFVVLVSAVVQGGSLPRVARWLGLQLPPRPEPPISLEITSLFDVDADIVEYIVKEGSRAAGRRLSELALPERAVVAMIARHDELIPPRGSTTIQPGDYVFVVLHRATRASVDRVFTQAEPASGPPRLRLPGATTVAELTKEHGLRLLRGGDITLEQLLREQLGDSVGPDDVVLVDGIALRAEEVADGRVTVVAVSPTKSEEGAARRPDTVPEPR